MTVPNTGRPCTVCRHAERVAIDKALIAQEGFEAVSRRFKVNPDALARHFKNHVPTEAMQAGAEAAIAAEVEHGSGLLGNASVLHAKALELLAKAEKEGDVRTALAGVREAANCLQLMAKLAGQIDESATINVTFAPQFLLLQKTIIRALAPHPEALRAVQGAFVLLEGAAE